MFMTRKTLKITGLPSVGSFKKVTGRVVTPSRTGPGQGEKRFPDIRKFVHRETKSYMPCGILITMFLKIDGYSSPVFYET